MPLCTPALQSCSRISNAGAPSVIGGGNRETHRTTIVLLLVLVLLGERGPWLRYSNLRAKNGLSRQTGGPVQDLAVSSSRQAATAPLPVYR